MIVLFLSVRTAVGSFLINIAMQNAAGSISRDGSREWAALDLGHQLQVGSDASSGV